MRGGEEAQHGLGQQEQWENKKTKMVLLTAIRYFHMGYKVSPTRQHHVTTQKDHNINNHCHRNLNIYIIRLLSCLSYRMPMLTTA